MQTIELTCDAAPLLLQLSELTAALDGGIELTQSLRGRFNALANDGNRLVTVRPVDGGVVLEPSELLLELVALVRNN